MLDYLAKTLRKLIKFSFIGFLSLLKVKAQYEITDIIVEDYFSYSDSEGQIIFKADRENSTIYCLETFNKPVVKGAFRVYDFTYRDSAIENNIHIARYANCPPPVQTLVEWYSCFKKSLDYDGPELRKQTTVHLADEIDFEQNCKL